MSHINIRRSKCSMHVEMCAQEYTKFNLARPCQIKILGRAETGGKKASALCHRPLLTSIFHHLQPMATMKAVLVKQPGDASQLYIGETDKPVPQDDQILVKVKYFCLNRMDISQRHGRYPPPPGASQILGVEVSGIVEEAGKNVKDFKVGDKVFGLMGGGGYASYAVINHYLAMHIPDTLTFQQAAAIPEVRTSHTILDPFSPLYVGRVWFTAYQVLHFVAGLREGQDVLIHAGASGVGAVAIQLARLAKAWSDVHIISSFLYRYSNRVFATSGSDEKVKLTESLGATAGFNYKTTDWKEKVLELTENKGVDIIIDFVGKDYIDKNLAAVAKDGRIVFLSFLSGSVVEKFDLSILLAKRIRLEGTGLRSRTLAYQRELRDAIHKNVVQAYLEQPNHGGLKITIDREYAWSQIQEAHRYLESNQSTGKIVVRVEDE
ncbi:hypothetical protein BC938DRAFT_482030 [Jimgerdemannia flammicorona]|uniref:Enoyl reductase (ER) domain-containing protein n=1 Tax=Jimgerdemannia flammicorona TaxID=994334 RepID=A0A433QEV5_9FUNG|nr:hypothetical protein BC938DRAFT_482030 [Jimgerdemannia flammicorona]